MRTHTLQRQIGNAAVARLIQRDNPPAAPASLSYQAPAVFDDIRTAARTRGEAGMITLLMADRLTSLRDSMDGGEGVAAINNVLPALHGFPARIQAPADPGAALTQDDISQLTIVGGFAASAYTAGMTALRTRILAVFDSIFQPPDMTAIQRAEEEIAEALHRSYINSSNESTVQQLREGLKQIGDYKESVDSVITWARRAASVFSLERASRFLNSVHSGSEFLGTGLTRLTQVATVAGSLQRLFGSAGSGEVQDGIQRFRAALDVIDVGMSFAGAVPLLGTLWSQYYAPLTRAILNTMQRVFELRDVEGRQLSLVEWMTRPRAPGETPIIPRGLETYFPGGQAVLNFMYPLVNDGDPVVTPAVETYFIQNISRFNAGLASRDRLTTESDSHWYNPLSWGSADRAPNLLRWARTNQDTIWAQLYGSLPHNLR